MEDLRAQLKSAVEAEAKGINRARVDSALTEEMVKILKADLPFSVIQSVRRAMGFAAAYAQ